MSRMLYHLSYTAEITNFPEYGHCRLQSRSKPYQAKWITKVDKSVKVERPE